MKSDTPLDHAVFQLSPKLSRCELFVSSNGNTEKLASGLVKPFVTHLKIVEEQVALAVQSIKLEIERDKNAETWFTKGTFERFVRFVSTPEVLEMVNTFDAEMSQLEAARTIYSQGAGDERTDAEGGDGTRTTAAADATKKELLRAIDLRLTAVRQDLTTACARASAAGFNPDTVSQLQHFANQFGAHRLNEACTKFISVYHGRSDLISPWKTGGDDRELRSSVGSDMSIDDPYEDQSGPQVMADQAHPCSNPKPSTWQQNKSFVTFASRRNNVNEKHEDAKGEIRDNVSEEKNKAEAATESPSIAATQPARRLSVQDRINLFENKQKESSGGKPIVVKSVELRRLSSDVSSGPTAAEKSVLRRWSGASDMSIDVSGEKKDTESPLCTTSSVSSVSQIKPNAASVVSEDKGHQVLNNSEDAFDAEPQSGPPKFGDGGLKDQTDTQTYFGLSAAQEEPSFHVPTKWMDQAASQTKFGSFTGRVEQAVKNDQGSSQEKSEVSAFDEGRSGGYKGQVGSESQLRGFSNRSEIAFAGAKSQFAPQVPVGVVTTTVGDVASDVKFSSRREDSGTRIRLIAQSHIRGSHNHSRSFSGQFEGGAGLKFRDASSVLFESHQSKHQPRGRSFTEEVEESVKKESSFSVKQQIKIEDSEVPKMKYQKPHPGNHEQINMSHSKRDESWQDHENSKLNLPVKEVLESQDSIQAASFAKVEQVQRVRQSKGNQVLNDELKMKANELEKLFAEHKLRVPGDQSSSARIIEPANTHVEQAVNAQHRRPEAVESTPQMPARNTMLEPAKISTNVADFDAKSLTKMVENHNCGDALGQSFSNLNFDDSRGKFYENYMQKRDAKLREEWSSRRVEKEARMKAMQDSLERSRAEMKAKFSGSTDRQDSVSNVHQRAEKLRSLSFKLKGEQHPIESPQNEEDGDLSEFSEEKVYGQGRLFSESTLGDSASRQSRKNFPGRNVSSTPRTAITSIPRSPAKISSSVSGRRRGQFDSPLAQSVLNFSDLRKENTRPSGISKTTTRSRARNYVRSKSINEEIAGIKDEKSKRTQWKSSATPAEFKDLSSLNSDGVVLAPLKFDMEQIDLRTIDQSQNGLESMSFLKMGNSIGPGSGASAVRMKASMASETQQNEHDELEFEVEDMGDAAKEEEDEIEAVEDYTYTNNGRARLNQESEKSGNSGSEIDDSTRSLTQVDPVSVAEIPSAMVSTFKNVGSLQDSPVESPVSLNSRMCYPFSYPHESSDIDASMDSPIGSPASWNSHSLAQNEIDAARMRKNWGSAHKPFVVTNSSHNQSRKDVRKGFKRLLKFGRKNRGSESLVDWISATTSEGDDDTEDGRDLPNKSSEDFRRSRMGFSQGHPSDDNFNENELFSDQVQSLQSSIPAPPAHFKLRDDHISGSSLKAPRSFFSLSSFRSKGNDTKPRMKYG